MAWRASRRAGGVLVDELASSFGKSVHLDDFEDPHVSDSDEYSEEEEDCEEIQPYGAELVKPSPSHRKGSDSVASADEEEDEPETMLQLLFSDESASRMPLVSAIKGSREKQGLEPRKLTVTWAPDVYDPIPDSLCYATKTKQKKSRKDKDIDEDENNYKKKTGKKGQKGNAARGGGKDKKQFHKQGGRSDKCYKTMGYGDDDF